VVVGTVIHLGGEQTTSEGRLLQLPVDLLGKLRKTLRLDNVVLRQAVVTTIGLNEPTEALRPDKDSTLRTTATLLGFNQELATYRIEVRDGEQALSDSKVSVRIGERAVVGALDGEAAPYLFLVVHPMSLGGYPPPEDESKSQLIKWVAPAYPREAKEKRIGGTVIVKARVREDGQVSDLRVHEPVSPVLDQAALDAISQWRYRPALDAGGQAISVEMTLTVRYALR
jgi:TonB family protein